MPTVEEVCSTFGLTDVDVQYSDTDLENLTTYKLFQQHVRPLLVKENPKVTIFFILEYDFCNIRKLELGHVNYRKMSLPINR